MRTLLIALLLACTQGRGRAQSAPRAEDFAAQYGVDAAALAKIRAGQVFQMARPDLTERDLAMGFVFECKAAPEKAAHELLRGIDLGKDPSIVAWHRISAASAAQDLETLHLSPNGDVETKKYRSAEDGDTLNLSSAEIAAFRALPPTASVSDTEAQLRKMLLQRYPRRLTRLSLHLLRSRCQRLGHQHPGHVAAVEGEARTTSGLALNLAVEGIGKVGVDAQAQVRALRVRGWSPTHNRKLPTDVIYVQRKSLSKTCTQPVTQRMIRGRSTRPPKFPAHRAGVGSWRR